MCSKEIPPRSPDPNLRRLTRENMQSSPTCAEPDPQHAAPCKHLPDKRERGAACEKKKWKVD